MKKIYTVGALALALGSCKPNATVTTPPKSGDVVFTNYLAIGDALSAGYADNSLTVSGQINSTPQRLFEQFATVKDGEGATGPFFQPLVTGDNGYPNPKLVLGTVHYHYCDTLDVLGPMNITLPLDSTGSYHYSSGVNNNQVNNISVPFIRVADYPVIAYAANHNKYATRFYYDANKTPLEELYSRVANVHPTFYTMWLGASDVLGYAVAGGQGDGTGVALPINTNYYNANDITPHAVFNDIYHEIVKAAGSTSAQGALINVPDITALPFFTTVPSDGLVLTRQEQVDSMQALYSTYVFDKAFQIGRNQFIVEDNVGGIRQSVPGELILMTIPRDSVTCAGWGSRKPIPRQYVLTTDELQSIRAAVTSYNAFIKHEAELHQLAYVDAYAFFKTLSSGMAYNGINYSTAYVSGGAFSLDGIHLNQRGNALMANYILNTINTYYHSTVPMTDANKYPGVKFP